MLTADKEVQVHRDCIDGFCKEATARALEVVEVVEMFDHYDMAYKATRRLVERFEQLRGIYVTSYNGMPVCDCLKDLSCTGKIKVVAQDLNQESIARLRSGELAGLLFQNPFEQGRCAVEKMFRYLVENRTITDSLILPQLVLRSNLQGYVDEYVQKPHEKM